MTATLKSTQAVDAIANEPVKLPVLPLTFIPIKDYTTFYAELAITEGDLVFHFYKTPESQNRAQYWDVLFPQVLSATAEAHFGATYPRLKAAFTPEKDSWWMRAFGFGMVLDPWKFAYRFLEVLDGALDTAMTKMT